jgi:hypothetical protein
MTFETLDLHGYTVSDAIVRFISRYNRLLADSQGRGADVRGIEVIHGKGTAAQGGLIREALRDYLKDNGKRITGFDVQLVLRGSQADLQKYRGRCAFIHGEDADRNAGKTIVIPMERLRRPENLRYYTY